VAIVPELVEQAVLWESNSCLDLLWSAVLQIE